MTQINISFKDDINLYSNWRKSAVTIIIKMFYFEIIKRICHTTRLHHRINDICRNTIVYNMVSQQYPIQYYYYMYSY